MYILYLCMSYLLTMYLIINLTVYDYRKYDDNSINVRLSVVRDILGFHIMSRGGTERFNNNITYIPNVCNNHIYYLFKRYYAGQGL